VRSRFARRSTAVVPPPAYPVMGRRSSDTLTGEIVLASSEVRLPSSSSESAA
jgi:hypothetical protein